MNANMANYRRGLFLNAHLHAVAAKLFHGFITRN